MKMSRKNWENGHDFEKGRQAYRDERKFEAGLGRTFRVLGSGAIGGILFILFVLLCLGSVVWDAIDQSEEIRVENRKIIEKKMLKWMAETGQYGHLWSFDLGYCAVKENTIVATTMGTSDGGHDWTVEYVLHSADAGDNWKIVWRSDKNEYAEILSGPQGVEVISEDQIRISFIGGRTNMYTDELKKLELCTLDGGETWELIRVY